MIKSLVAALLLANTEVEAKKHHKKGGLRKGKHDNQFGKHMMAKSHRYHAREHGAHKQGKRMLFANEISDVAAGVEGFLEGALEAENLNNLETCIKDVELVAGDAEHAYQDCKVHDLSHKVKCTADLGKLASAAKNSVKDCKNIKADWDKLEAMVKILENPKDFAIHTAEDLIINGKNIYHEIQDAVKSYEAHDYRQFGVNVGMATSKLLLGEEQPSSERPNELVLPEPKPVSINKEQFAQIMKGFYSAFGGKFDLLALLVCIGDEDKALMTAIEGVMAFEDSIKSFREKDWGNGIGKMIVALLIEGAAKQTFEQGLPACENIWQKTQQLEEYQAALKAMSTANIQALEDDIKVNGVSILYKIDTAMNAIEHGDYEEFGLHMGEILKLSTRQHELREPEAYKPKKEIGDFAELLQGYYAALGYDMPFMQILMCIYQADQAALELYADVQLWEEAFRDKSWFEGLFAVIFLFAFGQAVRGQVLPICVPLGQDNWAAYDKLNQFWSDPLENLDLTNKEISLGGQSLTEELVDAGKKCMAGKFYDCGHMIGTAFGNAPTDKNLFLY